MKVKLIQKLKGRVKPTFFYAHICHITLHIIKANTKMIFRYQIEIECLKTSSRYLKFNYGYNPIAAWNSAIVNFIQKRIK